MPIYLPHEKRIQSLEQALFRFDYLIDNLELRTSTANDEIYQLELESYNPEPTGPPTWTITLVGCNGSAASGISVQFYTVYPIPADLIGTVVTDAGGNASIAYATAPGVCVPLSPPYVGTINWSMTWSIGNQTATANLMTCVGTNCSPSIINCGPEQTAYSWGGCAGISGIWYDPSQPQYFCIPECNRILGPIKFEDHWYPSLPSGTGIWQGQFDIATGLYTADPNFGAVQANSTYYISYNFVTDIHGNTQLQAGCAVSQSRCHYRNNFGTANLTPRDWTLLDEGSGVVASTGSRVSFNCGPPFSATWDFGGTVVAPFAYPGGVSTQVTVSE